MSKFTIKILLDFEAADDLQARHQAAETIGRLKLDRVREIVLHAHADRKSIRMTSDGAFIGQWNRSGRSTESGA